MWGANLLHKFFCFIKDSLPTMMGANLIHHYNFSIMFAKEFAPIDVGSEFCLTYQVSIVGNSQRYFIEKFGWYHEALLQQGKSVHQVP